MAQLVALVALGAPAFDMAPHRITGMMIAVYTPMKGLELDLDRIPAYAAFLADKNITNVMPAGSNGESLSLSVPERKALAEAWAKAAPPLGLRVYMHIGSESLVESIDLAKHAASTAGISGILAMTPVYFKPTTETLVDFLAAVANAAPSLPFWFYHFPDDTGVMPGGAHKFLELADSSRKIPTLMGIKYTDYNLMDFALCTQVGGGKYNMLYGRDEQAIAALMLGAEAAVSSTIGYSPTLRKAVTLALAGKQAEAKAQQELNAKLCSFFGQYESLAMNVQKNIMRMVGMAVGPSRLPKRDLDDTTYKALETQLRDLDLLD
jgi:N-acetylneuraminate lyase